MQALAGACNRRGYGGSILGVANTVDMGVNGTGIGGEGFGTCVATTSLTLKQARGCSRYLAVRWS